MPAGVPSSFQAYDPCPIVVKHAAGSQHDRRRRQRVRRLRHGLRCAVRRPHEPGRARAVIKQLDHGTLYVTPCELNADVGELLAERYGLPMWRPTNSGTEATMDAIRLARGATGAREARQGRGRLPRPPRRGDGLEQAVARRRRPGRRAQLGAAVGRPHARAPSTTSSSSRSTTPRRSTGRSPVEDGRGVHRRAGDGEHRHLPARRGLPRSGQGDLRQARHPADLRRGQDRHHRRVRRRHQQLRRAARPRARSPSRSAAVSPSARSAARPSTWTSSRTAPCSTSAPTTATRS